MSQRALDDLVRGAKSFRVWTLLAHDDLQARYRRTVLGPFWQTILHAGMIIGLTILFSNVLKRPVNEFLLYVTAGVTGWTLITGLLLEGSTAFSRGQPLIQAYDLPASLHVFRVVLNQMIVFAHNLVVYAGVILFTQMWPTPSLLLLAPGLTVIFLAGVGWALVFGLLGARFRDVTPAIGAATTILFLLTPIFWHRADIENAPWFVDYNPLYHLLELVRQPLMGGYATPANWAAGLAVAAASLVVGAYAFVAYRRQISYWG